MLRWRERVGPVQPEHAVEDAPGLLEAAQAPEAQTESVLAVKERPVIAPAPGQQAVALMNRFSPAAHPSVPWHGPGRMAGRRERSPLPGAQTGT